MRTFSLELFCRIDDFCQSFESSWQEQLLESGERKRRRKSRMSLSEMLIIVVSFHSSGFRTFKDYYKFLEKHHSKDFPKLLSYSRFVHLQPMTIIPLMVYLQSRKGEVTGISFIDSTPVIVCGIKRKNRNKVFDGIAKLGKSSIGWFFGFKLHLIINDRGEIISFCLTHGNVDDRVPVLKLAKDLVGKLYGDKGYISKELFLKLFENGVQLFTQIKSNMKNCLISMEDKILLRKRSLIETVNDQLKNISQVEHTRHRSPKNFLVNLLAALTSYSHKPKKPSLKIHKFNDMALA